MSRIFSASLAAAGVIFSKRMNDFNSLSLQITGAGSGNTIVFETSNDGTTWYAAMGIESRDAEQDPISELGAVGFVVIPKTGAYLRARISVYGSGTVTIVGELSKAPVYVNKAPEPA